MKQKAVNKEIILQMIKKHEKKEQGKSKTSLSLKMSI